MQVKIRFVAIGKYYSVPYLYLLIDFGMSSTDSGSTQICDGDNLAIILALYWLVYLIINAVIFAAVLYALRECFIGVNSSGHKNKDRDRSPPSRTNSRRSLISNNRH